MRGYLKRALLVVMVVALGSFVACGGNGGAGDRGSIPGEAADASEATQTIKVSTLDKLRFDPPSIELSAGDVVTFVVTNEGDADHEFVLGDEAYHEGQASGGGHDMSMENAVTVAPGETEELTWRFEDAGEVLYGCHVDGHYDGCMVGKIEVS